MIEQIVYFISDNIPQLIQFFCGFIVICAAVVALCCRFADLDKLVGYERDFKEW